MTNSINKNNSSDNIPTLRFPEFSGEWEKKKLGKISSYTKGFAFKSEHYKKKGVRIIRVSDLAYNSIKTDNEKIFIDEISANEFNKYRLEKNNIIITTVGSNPDMIESAVGRGILIRENNGFLNQNMLKLNNIKGYDNRFVIGLLNTKKYQHYMKSIARGNANQSNITVKELFDYDVKTPQLAEQQKIATFLTAVDSKIEQLQKKKSLLEQYKKGVMQQLFSQTLRFKPALSEVEGKEDGTNYPNWEEKRLGEVCKYYDGTHQTPNYVEHGVPFYSVEHVTANQFINTKYISEEVFEKENKRVKLNKGDILMTRIGSIGVAKYIDWNVRASFYVSLALIKTKTECNSKYLSHFISSVFFQKELWKRTIHVAFPQKINLGEIGNCIVLLPKIEEQTQIANFLSAIDVKIDNCKLEIENYSKWKKGLLQQLFV